MYLAHDPATKGGLRRFLTSCLKAASVFYFRYGSRLCENEN